MQRQDFKSDLQEAFKLNFDVTDLYKCNDIIFILFMLMIYHGYVFFPSVTFFSTNGQITE